MPKKKPITTLADQITIMERYYYPRMDLATRIRFHKIKELAASRLAEPDPKGNLLLEISDEVLILWKQYQELGKFFADATEAVRAEELEVM